MKEGERGVSIFRWKMINQSPVLDEDEIYEAVDTSLTICNKCTAIAQSRTISFKYAGKILQVEKEGFYWFVQHRLGKEKPWKYNVEKDMSSKQCSICRSELVKLLFYNLIEIHDCEIDENGDPQPIEETRIDLAALCSDCCL
jgi:hypothetical protein